MGLRFSGSVRSGQVFEVENLNLRGQDFEVENLNLRGQDLERTIT
jgi:hypothetical protein